MRVNDAIVEKFVDNKIQMGKLIAVHDEKLDKQDRIDAVLFEKVESVHREVNRRADEIKKGCERDIMKVDSRLREMEKKMWTIFGALAVVSFMVSMPGQKLLQNFLTPGLQTSMIEPGTALVNESSRF